VRAPALDDARASLLQATQRGDELVDGGEKIPRDGGGSRDVQCRWEGVVGTLAHVHGVVGVEAPLAGNGVAAVGNDLVDVHV
jgi:hypothetical protein